MSRWAAVGVAGIAGLILAVATVLILMAGDGGTPPLALPPTVPAVPTAPGTVTPGPSATATVGPPPEIVGPLFAYSRDAGGGVHRPIREVVVHDLGGVRDVWSFPYGSSADGAIQEHVAGNQIVLATSAGVRVTDLHGGSPRALVDFDEDERFWAMSSSSDDRLLAVARANDKSGAWQLDVLELATGEGILTVTSAHPALQGFVGVPAGIAWQPGNHAFTAIGATESEMHGDVATVALDGTVRMWKTAGYPILSPNGTRVAWASTFANDCYRDNPSLGERLKLVDLVTGDQYTYDPGPRIAGVQWSPNSAWLLHELFAPVEGSCEWVKNPIATEQLDFISAATGSVASPAATLREWNSDPLIEMDCGDGEWRLVDRYFDGRRVGVCANAGGIRVNHVAIGEGAGTVFFGFVSGPARPGDPRVVIYKRQATSNPPGEVVAYFMATAEGRVLSGFDGPVDEAAGKVVVADGRRLTILDARDGQLYDLVISDGSRGIQDVALSPDGTLVAVALGDFASDWNVDILNATDGALIARLDAATTAPPGPIDSYPARLLWRDDGRGVVVAGGVGRDGPAGLLTFWVDGFDTRVPDPGFHAVSPNGRLAVVGIVSDETSQCFTQNSHDFRIIDLATVETLVEFGDAAAVFNAPRWSADSSAVALSRYEPPFDDACDWTRRQPTTVLIDVPTGTVAHPGDASTVNATWSDASIRCDGEKRPLAFDRFFSRRGDCPTGALSHELLVDGIVVDTGAMTYEVLGVID